MEDIQKVSGHPLEGLIDIDTKIRLKAGYVLNTVTDSETVEMCLNSCVRSIPYYMKYKRRRKIYRT